MLLKPTVSILAQIYVTIPDMEAEKGVLVAIPVHVSDLTNRGVISYQFVATFDERVLDAIGATSEETLTFSWGAPYVNTNVNGQITVGGYGISELIGSGVLVRLKFVVVGDPGQVTDLSFSFFIFNNGDPMASLSGGVFTVASPIRVICKETVKVPKIFSLEQNYPNPFNSMTTIRYQIPRPENITIKIFNSLSREVRTLVSEKREAGYYEVDWDGKDKEGKEVSSGIYFCKGVFENNRKIITKKMIKLR